MCWEDKKGPSRRYTSRGKRRTHPQLKKKQSTEEKISKRGEPASKSRKTLERKINKTKKKGKGKGKEKRGGFGRGKRNYYQLCYWGGGERLQGVTKGWK